MEDRSFRNAYWDGKKYHCPPQVQLLPDLTYHGLAHPYLSDTVAMDFRGESGALVESYADIFTVRIKQRKAGGLAADDAWLFAPGAVAWMAGKDPAKDRTPLRSLKAPGTAYRNDPLLGSDPQPDHYSKRYTGETDSGGVHINCGIPSKAFYLTASALDPQKAEDIWYTFALSRSALRACSLAWVATTVL